jgi:HK97 family phage portal protein
MSVIDLINNKNLPANMETKVSRIQAPSFVDNIMKNLQHFDEEKDKKLDFVDQYKEATWVFAAVQAITTSLSSLPLNVFTIKTEQNNESSRNAVTRLITKYGSIKNIETKLINVGRSKTLSAANIRDIELKIEDIQEVSQGDFFDFMENPNPHASKGEFWEREALFMELRGNSFWEMVGTQEGAGISETNRPVEMHLLHPDNVLIVPDKKKYIKGFLYEVNGIHIPFEDNEVVHRKFIDPTEEYYGMTPIEALIDTLTMERRLLKFNQAFFKNQATPDGVLRTEQRLNDKVFERVRDQWNDRHQGIRNAHKVAVLEQGLEFQNIGISQKEADFIETRKMNRQDILAAYKVPPVIVGLESVNRAVADAQERIFWSNNIKPKAKKRDSMINKRLSPLFGNDFFVETDFSSIRPLQEDRSEEFKRLIETGQMTPNEAREINNRPLSDDPAMDSFYISPNLIPIGDITSSGSGNDENLRDDDSEDEEVDE